MGISNTMDAFICDAVRTPIGRLSGNLAPMRPDDMAAHVIRGLMARNPSLDPNGIDEVIFGCANQAGEDNRNVARMASLLAGLPAGACGRRQRFPMWPRSAHRPVLRRPSDALLSTEYAATAAVWI